jgi:hypothetical protein
MRCAEAASGLAVFGELAALPAAARALFDRAPDRDLFCSTAWYETVLLP